MRGMRAILTAHRLPPGGTDSIGPLQESNGSHSDHFVIMLTSTSQTNSHEKTSPWQFIVIWWIIWVKLRKLLLLVYRTEILEEVTCVN